MRMWSGVEMTALRQVCRSISLSVWCVYLGFGELAQATVEDHGVQEARPVKHTEYNMRNKRRERF